MPSPINRLSEVFVNKSIPNWISVFLGAILLLFPAFRNGYPFLYADTGSYISAGFDGNPNGIRTMTYGIFMRHFSLAESFWLVAFFQTLMVSWVIHLFLKRYPGNKVSLFPLSVILLLVLTTSVGIVSGMLMPDYLTPLMILCGGMLFLERRLSVRETIVASILLLFSISSHHSHGLIFALVLGVYFLTYSARKWLKLNLLRPRRLLLLVSILVVGYFSIPALHYAYTGNWFREKSSHVFIMNRFHKTGLLQPFLTEKCGEAEYELCEYSGKLPPDLLWSPESPANQNGGWQAHEKEFNRVIRDFLSSPLYLKKFVVKEFESGFLQFFTFEGQVIFKERENGPAFPAVIYALRTEAHSMWDSLQYREKWSQDVINFFLRLWVPLCLFSLTGIYFNRAINQNGINWSMIYIIFLGLWFNAFVCAAVSMVDERFQFRVIWLLPLALIQVCNEWLSSSKEPE